MRLSSLVAWWVVGLLLTVVINISSSSPAINKLCRLSQLATFRRHRVDNTWRSHRWQHAMKPDTGRKSRFLPTPPAFYAPVRGFPSEYFQDVWCWKTRMVWLPGGEKKLKVRLLVLTESTNVTQTDVQTDTAWRYRPRLCIASRGKIRRLFLTRCTFCNS